MKEELLQKTYINKAKKALNIFNSLRFRWHAGWGIVMTSMPAVIGTKYKTMDERTAALLSLLAMFGAINSYFSYKMMEEEAKREVSPFRVEPVSNEREHKIRELLFGFKSKSRAKNMAVMGFLVTSRVVRLLPGKGPALRLLEIGFIEAGFLLAASVQLKRIDNAYYRTNKTSE